MWQALYFQNLEEEVTLLPVLIILNVKFTRSANGDLPQEPKVVGKDEGNKY